MKRGMFRVGQKVRVIGCDGVGEVAVVVPPMFNPMHELRRALGTKPANVRISRGNDRYFPLRDVESYIVRVPYKNTQSYKWPLTAKLEACDG